MLQDNAGNGNMRKFQQLARYPLPNYGGGMINECIDEYIEKLTPSSYCSAASGRTAQHGCAGLCDSRRIRLMWIDGELTFGFWHEMDCEKLRSALATVQLAHVPIRYLEDDDVAARYRTHKPDSTALNGRAPLR
jgi:hypothetical protein